MRFQCVDQDALLARLRRKSLVLGSRPTPKSHCGREVYRGQQSDSRAGKQQGLHFTTPYTFEHKFEPSDSAAIIQRTAASQFDRGRQIDRCLPSGNLGE